MKTHCALCQINLYKSWFASLILFSLMLFTSCHKEGDAGYLYEENKESVYPALIGGQDLRIKHVIQELRAVDHGTNLARKFAEAQAHPLWEHAILADQGIDTLLFVPVRSDLSPGEIRTIWVFQIHGDTTFSYHFYHRNRVSSEERWRFDYFTTFALDQSPKDGLRFTTVEGDQIPRALVPGGFKKRCVRWAAYLDGDPNPIWHTRCWEEWEPTHHEGDDDEIGYPREDENDSDRDRREPRVDGNGGGGGVPSPSPVPSPLNMYFDEIDKIQGFEGTRVDVLYERLRKSGRFTKFLLSSFTKEPPHLGHLHLKLDVIPDEVDPKTNKKSRIYGRTQFLKGDKYTQVITLNSLYIDRMTDLYVATVLLHEIIHAHFNILKLTIDETYKTEGERTTALRKAAPGIADYYERFRSNFSHEMFHHSKKDFIETIKNLFKDPSLKDERCEAIFWAGLRESLAYKELKKDEKIKYEKLLEEELNLRR